MGSANETVVAETTHSEIVLTPYGFYGRCKDGCPWAGESTPSKSRARMDAVMHDEDPERAGFHAQPAARKWNVLAPVVAVLPGETAAEAISALRGRLTAAGFNVYDGEPGCSAFEAEDTAETAAITGSRG